MIHNLVIMRQAETTVDRRGVSEAGKRQYEEMAAIVYEMFGREKAKVFCCPTETVIEGAGIIATRLNTEVEVFHAFGGPCTTSRMYDGYKVLRHHEKNARNMVLVVHLDWAEKFPAHFCGLYCSKYRQSRILSPGEAVQVDCRNQTIHNISY